MILTKKISGFFSWLSIAETIFLSLMIVSLPSLEAPKNIFLIFFLLSSILRQLIDKRYTWEKWDWIFFFYIGTALLSALFPSITPGDEWRSFRGMLAWTSVGWLISRTKFSANQLKLFFFLIILGAIPPTIVGLIESLSTGHLQLHSVGHENHSAIYLCMILGASLGLNLSSWSSSYSKWKVTLCLNTLFFVMALIITESRAAVGVGFILCFALILLSEIRKSIKISLLVILAITIPLMFQTNIGVVKKHFNSLTEDSKIFTGYEKYLGQRSLVWNVSFEALRFNHLFGVGNGNWRRIKEEDLRRSVESRGEIFYKDKYMISAGHSHNVYLSAAVERGLIGFIALITLIIGWFNLLKRSFRDCKNSPMAGYIWAGSFSGWLTTFGIGFVNSTFHHEHAILAMLLLGIHISFSKNFFKVSPKYKKKKYGKYQTI